MAHVFRPEPWHSTVATLRTRRHLMGLQRLTYRYVGRPRRGGARGGRPIEPPWAKRADHPYFGAVSIYERILWLPDRADVEVRLDGRSMRIRPETPRPARRPETIRDRVAGVVRAASPRRLRAWRAANPHASATRSCGLHAEDDRRRPLPQRLGASWTGSTTRTTTGSGCSRRARARPDVNAWFVLRRHTATAPPPAGRGTASSRTARAWRSLMLNARWLLSSHADAPISTRPRSPRGRRSPTGSSGFLSARRDQGRPVAVAQPA